MNNLSRFGFLMEQSMPGHRTYTQNLIHSLSQDSTIDPTWMLVQLDEKDIWQIIPNVSSRLSLRAREMALKAMQDKNLDGLFYHTQMITLFSLLLMKRIPTVISLDATPLNFNLVAATYDAKVPTGGLALLKFAWYRQIFHSSTGLVAWSNWVKNSLVEDYCVQPDKVKVIYPGINLEQQTPIKKVTKSEKESLKLLFMGADFKRKGGYDLLEAFRHGLADFCELDIITKDNKVHPENSVRVYQDIPYKSPQFNQLLAEADIFVFPTSGDAMPVAILDAMAAGLPVITTNVGAIPEEVEDGVTGLLVPVNSPEAIIKAVRSLADDPERRVAMGIAGRARVEQLFNAKRNHQALVQTLKEFTQQTNMSKLKSSFS